MNKVKQVLLAAISLLAACQISAADISGIKSVAGRVAPWLKGRIEAVEIPSDNGNDVYEFCTSGNKLVIKANSIPAAGMALNKYLKHYCLRSFSLTGTNMDPVNRLPSVPVPVRNVCQYKYRHLLNFCTQNYSCSFWNWNDWERMIDYMVLNGVNLTISTVGLDKVWYNTLKQFGFTDEEILSFLPGPGFNAWHMMGNLEGWGGPVTKGMIDRSADLQKRIAVRLREYGIDPVFMSFYGMVPVALKDKYPDADIKLQGRWAGGFDRPAVLVPGQELYDRMADVYYKELKKLYGSFGYFAGEPFHEGGDRRGINVADMAKNVLDKMKEHFPGCRWVLQAWHGNPTTDFLSKLSKEDDVLIWDMKGELGAEWERREGYEGFPFMWGVINNFGETTGLYGRLGRFNSEWYRVRNSDYGRNLQGLCVSPEGILNNPVNYDMLFDLAWSEDSVDVGKWVARYSSYRYGGYNSNMAKVWEILLQTAYSDKFDASMAPPESKVLPAIAGNSESVICAPPALDVRTASSWGTTAMYYDYKQMRNIAPLLVDAIPQLKDVNAFRYDLVDFTRQLLANDFKEQYNIIVKACDVGDMTAFDMASEQMTEILDDMDELLSAHPDFMIGTWIAKARNLGTNRYEKDLYESNARILVTYWGPDDPSTDLRDYAHKEWGGLIKDVYTPRWKNFIDYQRLRMMGINCSAGHPVDLEIDWAKHRNVYPTEPQSDLAATATRILNKRIRCYGR